MVVRLIVDLSADDPQRLPDPADRITALCGVTLPRLRARTGADLIESVLAQTCGLYDCGHDRVMKFLSELHLRSASQCTK